MGKDDTPATDPLDHAELWGGLEHDLERLQGLIDGAVEEITRSFAGLLDCVESGADADDLRARFGEEARRVITCLQFHDVASQMIASLRGRAELLEMAALATTPDSMVEARSRLLADALRRSRAKPDVDFAKGGDVELF